jgi:adenosine deaminase
MIDMLRGDFDLHTHMGGSTPDHILWEIAQNLGYMLPMDDWWKFRDSLRSNDADCYFEIMDKVEEIQSNCVGVERSTYAIFSEAARQGVTYLELRFNPLKRVGHNLRVGQIVKAARRGFEMANDHYNINGGLIFCLGRDMTKKQNMEVLNKAIQYAGKGVIGIDVAGRETKYKFDPREYRKKFFEAKLAGLGVTAHVGEEFYEGVHEHMVDIIEMLNPDRIGHGIACYNSPEVMELIRKDDILLEVCPSSVISNGYVENTKQMCYILEKIRESRIKVAICTDGTRILETTIKKENEIFGKYASNKKDIKNKLFYKRRS